jgi:hypothetical protein
MSDLRISREKLLDASTKWSNLPDKFSTKDEINSLMEAVRVLEDCIKFMRQKRYSYKDISEKFLEEFHIDISPQTISSYLATIKKERENSLWQSKREARQSSKATLPKKTKKGSIAKVGLSVDGLGESVVDLDDTSINLSIEQKSVDNASISLKPSKNKQSATSKSIVPKLNIVESVDSTDDEDEMEKRRQAETLKHFNKY